MRKRILEIALIFVVIAVGLQSQTTPPNLPALEPTISMKGLKAGMSAPEAEALVVGEKWILRYNEPAEFCLLTPLNPAEEMWFMNESMVLFRDGVLQTAGCRSLQKC